MNQARAKGSGSRLAVIVPAFRSSYLAAALDSIAAQSDQHFQVYVGDDASPDDLATLVDHYRERITISYHRFPENLGGKSLVQHWNRCVALSSEPWVWLFSDDDVMEPDCVAGFHRAIGQTVGRYDVYRFNTVFINAEDTITRLNPPHPDIEGWKSFAYFLLRGLRTSTAQEVIFSRAAFEQTGGFVDLPLAWGSDHATLMKLAGRTGICTIQGPRVRFRWSGQNISSVRDWRKDRLKIKASMEFMRWFLQQIHTVPDTGFPLDNAVLRTAAFDWFKDHLRALHTWFGPATCRKVARFTAQTWGEPLSFGLTRMLKLNFGLLPYVARKLAHRDAGR